MISEYEFFHGVVFCKLIKGSSQKLEIKKIEGASGASYVVNSNVAIHIKYCSKRLNPWRFTFLYSHFCEVAELRKKYKNVFIILVCNNDGVVCLNYENFLAVTGEVPMGATTWISANRKKREMYAVKGQSGPLHSKVGLSSINELVECT